jgi:hypothetical protein
VNGERWESPERAISAFGRKQETEIRNKKKGNPLLDNPCPSGSREQGAWRNPPLDKCPTGNIGLSAEKRKKKLEKRIPFLASQAGNPRCEESGHEIPLFEAEGELGYLIAFEQLVGRLDVSGVSFFWFFSWTSKKRTDIKLGKQRKVNPKSYPS